MNDLITVVKLTTSCPGNCKGCTTRKEWFIKKCGNQTIMTKPLFRRVCTEITAAGGKYICFSGGEPTILPNLIEYITIAKEFNLVVRLNSNGWEVTYDNLRTWLCAGLDQIVLSVYGLSYEEVVKLRGNGEIFTRNMQAIDAISKLKQEKEFSFTAFFQTIIMHSNYRSIPKLFKSAIENNFDIFWPSYLEDAFECESEIMTNLDIEMFRHICMPEMVNIAKYSASNSTIATQMSTQIAKYYTESNYENGIYHSSDYLCDLVGNFIYVYPNGIVYPCPGHEYFMSENYIDLNKGQSILEVAKFNNTKYDFCIYCAQGKHIGINISNDTIDEHE